MKNKAANSEESITFFEAIRKRPAMYVGSTGLHGFIHLTKEFFASFYQHTQPSKVYSQFPTIIFEAETKILEITAKQSGIFRLDNLHSQIPDNINEDFNYFGFEFSFLNALSLNYEFILFDGNNQEILKQSYKKGILQIGKVEAKEYSAKSLEIRFTLDPTIWENFTINPILVDDIVKDLAYLNEDKTFEIKYSFDNKPCRVVYNFKNGLRDLIDIKSLNGWGTTICQTDLEYRSEDFSADICFAFWDYSINESFFKSFVNNTYTHDGGTHKKALLSGIERALKKYVKKHKANEFFVITTRTVLSRLIGAIHLKMKKPSFAGSFKGELNNSEIIKPISDLVCKNVFEKLENNSEMANSVIRHFAEIHWNKKRLGRL